MVPHEPLYNSIAYSIRKAISNCNKQVESTRWQTIPRLAQDGPNVNSDKENEQSQTYMDLPQTKAQGSDNKSKTPNQSVSVEVDIENTMEEDSAQCQ